MRRLEKVFSGVIIGFTLPLLLGLLSVAVWFYLDKSGGRVLVYMLTGVVLGFVINIKYLKGWIQHRFDLPVWAVSGIYILYNIFVFGFFMGFPVFNILLGLIAGCYFSYRIISRKIQPQMWSKLTYQVSLFTTLVMAFICVSAGTIALTDKFIEKNIQGMLALDFEVTRPMTLAIIFVGGFVLTISQYFVTKLTMVKTLKANS